MSDPQAKGSSRPRDIQLQNKEGDRRAQPRSETVLCRIEDATYAVLRKYETKSA